MKVGLFLLLAICLSVNGQQNCAYTHRDGIYYGKSGVFLQDNIFIKIHNDTIVIDWFIKEYLIYRKFTETIIIDYNSDCTIYGKDLNIEFNKNKIYVSTRRSKSKKEDKKIKISLNNNKLEDWETYKNEAYLYEETKLYDECIDFKYRDNFNELINKYALRHKTTILKHDEFKLELEKIKKELHTCK